jgi:hypothetical protein
MRVISPGSGRFANYDHEVILGLQPNEKLLSVEVKLPSGKKIEFKEPFKLMSSNELIIPRI